MPKKEKEAEVFESVTDGLKQIYKTKLKPLEEVRAAASAWPHGRRPRPPIPVPPLAASRPDSSAGDSPLARTRLSLALRPTSLASFTRHS